MELIRVVREANAPQMLQSSWLSMFFDARNLLVRKKGRLRWVLFFHIGVLQEYRLGGWAGS